MMNRELTARFLLSITAANCAEYLSAQSANFFDRCSDDDLDYFPANAAMMNFCAALIEPIMIAAPNSTECLDALAELDADAMLDLEQSDMHRALAAFLPNSDDTFDETELLERSMIRDATNSAFDALELADDAELRDIPADFIANFELAILNIHNAFINAHRAAYPRSYSDIAPYSTPIILDPNPYLK